MSHQSNLPGPGEENEAHIQGEAPDRPMPHGELPVTSSDHTDFERRTQEMKPISRIEPDVDMHRRDVLRRTGTDIDALRPVRLQSDLPEQRLDQSAHDLQRETRFDPAQDNAGPQSDKS